MRTPDAAFDDKDLLEAYEDAYPSESTFHVDDDIVLRIIGDGTPKGTKIIDSKSGRMIQGVTGIFLWLDAAQGLPKCAITFQRFETDLTPPLKAYANFDVIKQKLFDQGFTVVDNED